MNPIDAATRLSAAFTQADGSAKLELGAGLAATTRRLPGDVAQRACIPVARWLAEQLVNNPPRISSYDAMLAFVEAVEQTPDDATTLCTMVAKQLAEKVSKIEAYWWKDAQLRTLARWLTPEDAASPINGCSSHN